MRKAGTLVLGVTMWLGMSGVADAHHGADMRRLKNRIARLEQRVVSVERDLAFYNTCFTSAIPMGSFFGYVYRNDQGQEFLTSAFGTPDESQGERVDAWLATVDASCVMSGRFPAKKVSPQMR